MGKSTKVQKTIRLNVEFIEKLTRYCAARKALGETKLTQADVIEKAVEAIIHDHISVDPFIGKLMERIQEE